MLPRPIPTIIPTMQYGTEQTATTNHEQPLKTHVYSPVDLPKFTSPIENDTTEITEQYEKHCHHLLDSIANCHFSQAIISTFLPHFGVPLTTDVSRGLQKIAQDIEQFLVKAIRPVSDILYERKSAVVHLFSAKLQRCLAINQAAKAAADILGQPRRIEEMHRDWRTLDFQQIIEDALWIDDSKKMEIKTLCNVQPGKARLFAYPRYLVQEDVLRLFESKATLSEWMGWIKHLVERGLSTNACCTDDLDESAVLTKHEVEKSNNGGKDEQNVDKVQVMIPGPEFTEDTAASPSFSVSFHSVTH
ncbi:DNA-binding protein rfx2 [Apophysomyces ossiformis]|uniref:DNA-binding protein rfx2 n=1 Tax=Apophysomyces ossiformis TaxID=679940 RepID=A0A8H7ESV8_9FUNG|nr:DNA-binding protein rfx2 [Apophysomyces ossiformis]